MSGTARPDRARFVGPFDRVLYLKTLPGVEDLSVGELAVMARQTRERRFRKGDVLLREDEPMDALHLVVEGRVRVEKNGVTEHIAGPQDDVGTLHWLAQEQGGVTAVAEADTLTLEIPTAAMAEIFEDHFTILSSFIRGLADEVYQRLRHTAKGDHKSIWPQDEELPDRALDLVEKIVLLRRSPVFKGTSLETLAMMAESMEQTEFAPGETIWKQGDPAGSVFLILCGTVECTMEDEDRIFTCGAGYPMGNIESMAGHPRWYTAVAKDRVCGLQGFTSKFLDVMEDHHDLAMTFLGLMAAGTLHYMREHSVPVPK